MGNFKIIGIRANTDCDKKYTKVLKKDIVYTFYPNHQIDPTNDKVIVEKAIKDLYNLKNVEISVSAIAGKNGTGKSTIIELLFMAVNNLACLHSEIKTKLEFVDNLDVDVFFKTDAFYKLSVKGNSVKIYSYDEELNLLKDEVKDFNIENFFYSVVINYSQYALNTRDMGTWLNGLFHKNDGYQTPIVINPMRDEGNFDINIENYLAKARLISNLARPVPKRGVNFREITENLLASRLKLTVSTRDKANVVLYSLRKEKEKTGDNSVTSSFEEQRIKMIDLKLNKIQILKELNTVYSFNFNEEDYLSIEDDILPFRKLAYDYLFYKLVNIAVTYSTYSDYFDKEGRKFKKGAIKKYFQQIMIEDTSHIAFKLKQTLNFLKYRHLEFSIQNISFDKLSTKIDTIIKDKKNELNEENRIELIPPPIFDVDIVLESKHQKKDKDMILFSTLSSGEKQLIFSVSSVLYHLLNLDSVVHGFKYKNINIILDEIELYFHPEYQKKYIKYILDSIERLKFKSISAINFCFITHSPFILSDIPNSNILFLQLRDNDKSEQIEVEESTFCSNIHDLLAHSFFMQKGYMGEFATDKVKSVVKTIKKHRDTTQKEITNKKKKEIKGIIEIVGEPLLKQKLLDMYSDALDLESTAEKVERLERELREAKLEQLNIDENDKG